MFIGWEVCTYYTNLSTHNFQPKTFLQETKVGTKYDLDVYACIITNIKYVLDSHTLLALVNGNISVNLIQSMKNMEIMILNPKLPIHSGAASVLTQLCFNLYFLTWSGGYVETRERLTFSLLCLIRILVTSCWYLYTYVYISLFHYFHAVGSWVCLLKLCA